MSTLEQEKEKNRIIDERLKKLEKEQKLQKDIKANSTEILDIERKKGETIGEYGERVRESLDDFIEETRLRFDAAKMDQDAADAAHELYLLKEKTKKLSDKAIKDGKTAAELRKNGFAEEADALEAKIKQYDKIVSRAEDEIAAQERAGVKAKQRNKRDKKAQEDADKLFGSLAQKSLIFTKSQSGMASEMFNFAKAIKNADNPMEVLTNSFGKFFNLQNFAMSTVQKFVESTVAMISALDESNARFAAATGLGDKYQTTMLDMRQEGNTLGVTFENAGAALKGLTENMVGFAHMSKGAQKDLGMTVAQFERIGVDANTSAEFLNTFTLNMGMSEKQAMGMTKQLALMGQSAGISAGKMTKDFQAAFKSLAVYGEKSIEVFQGLSAAARAAGVEVATLTSLAGKFDTFAGSAETVGKLNALLGSQLSSTEMLMMTEDQRIETLVQQVQVGGTAFKDMNKFQQMAIANAAGISDMNEAQRVFGMNMKDYKKYRKDMEKQEAVQEKFNKAIEATIPLQEKLKIFAAEFTVAVGPLLELTEGLVDGLISIMKALGPTGTGFLAAATAVGVLGFALFAGIKVFRAFGEVKSIVSVFTKADTLADAMSTKIKRKNAGATIFQTINEKAKMAVQKISSFFTAKDSVEQKVNTEMKKENNKQTKKQIKNQKKSTKGAKKAVPIMLALGAAIMMIGAGAYMAATGMSNLVASFRGLSTGEIIAATIALVAFGYGVLSLVSILIGLVAGPQAVLTVAAVKVLLAIGGAILMIGAGVYLAATGMGNLVGSFADLAKLGADVILPLTAFVGSLALLMIAGPAGLAAAGGVMATMAALAAGLYAVSIVMDDEGLQNGLENLALVTTGTSAKAMTEGATAMAADLKTTVNAAMAQKIELVIKIKDGGLKEMVESVVVSDLKSPAGGPIAKAVASMV